MNPASPLVAALLLAGLVQSASGKPLRHRGAEPAAWTCLQGDAQRSGRGPALGLPVAEAWQAKLEGSLYSSPAIADGLVVLGSSKGDVTALSLSSGAQVWTHGLPDRVWGSGVAIDAGRVFVGCVDGCVHALNLQDGGPVGSYCAQKKGFWGERPDVLSSPLVLDGRLFFGSDNHDIYGWDLMGRRDLWRYTTQDILHDNSAAANGGSVYFPSRDGRLYALDAADGALRWSFGPKKAFNTIPTCDDDAVYAGNADGNFYAVDAADGHQRWAFKTHKGIMSSAALTQDGGLVFGSADGYVYCLDRADGKERWRFKTGDLVLASPLLTGGLVWIGSYDKNFYALDLATGEERWRMKLDGAIFTSAAAADGRIVVASRDGQLVCLVGTSVPQPPSGR